VGQVRPRHGLALHPRLQHVRRRLHRHVRREYKYTKDDTRKGILAVGGINVVCALLLPVAIVGDTAGKVLIALLCAGLLLMMNARTMSSSRVLHAMAKEGMTLRWFGRLNRNAVPACAMTFGLVLNAWLLFQFPTVFFILAVGNLGFLLAHVLALSGFLLLPRDRPRWPRPIRLGPFWLVVAACACLANLAFIVFGLIGLRMTGYAYDASLTSRTAWMGRIVIVGVVTLVLGCAGYVVAQHQRGKRFSLSDPSDEQPIAEAIDEVARERTIVHAGNGVILTSRAPGVDAAGRCSLASAHGRAGELTGHEDCAVIRNGAAFREEVVELASERVAGSRGGSVQPACVGAEDRCRPRTGVVGAQQHRHVVVASVAGEGVDERS
jgi:Amino acid permease